MTRKKLAIEILRTLKLLQLRHQQEKEFNEGKTYASELKAVEICLTPLIRSIEDKPVYVVEMFEDKQWKPVPFTSTIKNDLALLRMSVEKVSNQTADFRVGRYFREMEV